MKHSLQTRPANEMTTISPDQSIITFINMHFFQDRSNRNAEIGDSNQRGLRILALSLRRLMNSRYLSHLDDSRSINESVGVLLTGRELIT